MTSERAPLPFLFSARPLIILALLFALPSIPAPTVPLTAGRDLFCFDPNTPNAYPVDLDDCPTAIDLLYHEPIGVMTLQQFSRNPRLAPTTFQIPHSWQFKSCQVILTCGSDTAVDSFRLADVIIKASRIIDECPPKSKKSLGGIALVGHGESFFVAVNGPEVDGDGDGNVHVGAIGNGTRLVMLGDGDDRSGVAIVGPDLAKEGSTAS